ncbi:MAG: tetratricopeptide repeat protein [Lentimicrobium sp.]|jgi:signal transduction histidine kinase|nr:tetratricopeptide repeat protein [Lentimicrobium sp.]
MKNLLKTLSTALLMIFGTVYIQAQNAEIDSLNRLISKETDDKARIGHMLEKADRIAIISLDSAISLNLKIVEESKRINYTLGQEEARAKLVHNYSYQGNSKAALKQLIEFKQLAEQVKDSGTFANYYSATGLYYGMQSKYDSSIYFYEKAIPLYEKIGNRQRAGQSASNLAIGYQQQSNYPKALFYQQKALKIHEEDGNIGQQAYTVVNMANTYQNMGDNRRAESYFLKSIELAKQKQLTNVEVYAYTNLSSMFLDMLQWQKAYDYGMQAAELGGKMGDKGIQAASYTKAALAKARQNKPDEALALSKRAISLADSVNQPMITQQAYSGMGFVLKSQKKWKEAIPYYEKALTSLQNADQFIEENGSFFRELSECYEHTGNPAKALEMYKQYSLIADSVNNRNNIQKAIELTMNYEFEKKEQAEKVKQHAKDELNRTRMIGLGSGLFLSFIIIIGAAIGYRGKQRANTQLRKQKDEIENALVRLKEAQSQLIQSEKMASLGELTAGIAHEIQNPLNFVNNFSEVSTELIDELQEEIVSGNKDSANVLAGEIRDNLEKITHHGKRADGIVKGMLQHSRRSSGEKVPTDINTLADEYLRLAYHGMRAKNNTFNVTMKTDFDPTIDKVNVVPQDIGRAILNLINNAFYAVAEKGKSAKVAGKAFEPLVSLSTKMKDNTVEIRVTDNGTGIPETIIDKIFQPFFTTKPTGQGTGLGLSLSYDIITKGYGGELLANNKEAGGVEFIMSFPVIQTQDLN